MKSYQITAILTGEDLGTYEAVDEAGAREAMARDAGYASYAVVADDLGLSVEDAATELEIVEVAR